MPSTKGQPRQPTGAPGAGEYAGWARPGGQVELRADPRWPSLEWESLTWESSIPPDLLSRSAAAQLREPYLASIPPEIADFEVRLPRSAASDAEEASRLIRDFDREVGSEVAPFAAILLRTESASSSEIENLSSGAKQIALAEIGEDARANAAQIVGNVQAMRAALALSEDVDASTILAMHRALLERIEPAIAGRWRHDAVWIGGGNLSPHNAAFVPTQASRVPGAIEDLVAFAGRQDVPALAHAALVHAQFETIHPFPDGNGRTGRALVHTMLRKRALTHSVTVPVSAGLLTDTDSYFEALGAYRSGDVAPIVEAMSGAAVVSIANGRILVDDLRGARGTWADALRARSDSAVWPLMDLVLRQPVINTAVVQAEIGINHSNAMKAIGRLVEVGALAEVGGRRRSILWQSSQVLSALDAFAARAGRRAGQPHP